MHSVTMNETPCNFICKGADILSPLFEKDIVSVHREKYQRIQNTIYTLSDNTEKDLLVCTNCLEQLLCSTDHNLNDAVDLYLEYRFSKNFKFMPTICNYRLSWCLNQLQTFHEYSNLLYNGIFSIGIIESSDYISEIEWDDLIQYVRSYLEDLHLNNEFRLYDDSTNENHIITLEYLYKIDQNKLDDKTKEYEFPTNNLQVISLYRKLHDYSRVVSTKNVKIYGDLANSNDLFVLKETILELLNHITTDHLAVYNSLNSIILNEIALVKINKYDDNDISYYKKFIQFLALDAYICNYIAENAKDITDMDEILCILNTTAFNIKEKYMQDLGLLEDYCTMAIMYRNQLIKDKDIISRSLRRSQNND